MRLLGPPGQLKNGTAIIREVIKKNGKKFSVVIFGVILPFYNVQNESKFSQNRSGQAGGR